MADDDDDEAHVKLFLALGEAMHGHPVENVIPVLITASARALITDAGVDHERLARNYDKFCRLMLDQIDDMVEDDDKQAREATRQ